MELIKLFIPVAHLYGDITDYNNLRNLNALSKLLVENYLLKLKTLKKLIIARIFNMYDQDENFSNNPKIIEKLKTGKKFKNIQ